jgi:drug/metabolite transporter (DMT)-like permease
MGYFLGIASGMCYAMGAILYRIGQRSRPDDDGLLVSSFVNVVLLGGCALFVAWHPWNWTGFIGIVAGGISGSVFGRFAWLRGIRLVGPTRAGTFSAATPIPTAIAGWIFLDERLSPLEAVGGAVTIFGLIQIIRGRASGSKNEPVPVRSYLIAAIAPVLFGISIVLRKWGVEHFPGAVTGAFIGSAAGMVMLTLWEAGRRRIPLVVRTTFTNPPWAFCGAGLVTALAVLTQFRALALVEAWVIGILGGTAAIWTPFFSMAFLKQDEVITARLMSTIGMVFAGIVIIAIA